MKRVLFVMVAMLMLVGMMSAQTHKAGDKALLFMFNGFSNLGVSGLNGGVGGQLWLAPALSLRGTVGGLSTSNGGAKAANTSAAVLIGLGNTSNTYAYFGPQVFYNHVDPGVNTVSFDGVLGVNFSPWENVGLGAEYVLGITSGNNNVTTFQLGQTSGNIILSIGF